ncbi:DUF1549 and DUF1553 domain-containing protein [uncultured Paludibaculum sp.]|uniref:DUF1549 and DUF1553 domain-containing protein n=1 Tax=uncultured Paludibaculum sp. TaxID=1765020 RepID=UPI002AAB850A|nr:DUF1549 and DUF1553 domain-containing protein [uncultured Paludibaculum sp.]
MKLWAGLAIVGLLAAAEYHGDTDKDRARVLARRNWWSFQKVVRPEPPKLNSPWVRTPIDAFILEALRAKALQPSAAEDKLRLLRRVTLDVTGLPPKPAEATAFLNDKRADAYERLVDRLMASPQYGERWAQRWLDVARYADTNGFEHDLERTHAWRYRDYVVRSFNAGKPYDVFLKEQIAGDEIWPGQPDPQIAVGFHRAGPEHLTGGNQDVEQNRQEVLVEMTAGVSNVFLGLTMNCARCHNHKFDPILQTDYYRLQAVFAGTEGKEVPLASAEEKARYDAAQKAYKDRLKPIQDEITAIEKPYKDAIVAERRAKLEPAVQALLDVPKDKLSEADREKQKNAKDQITPSWDEVLARVSKPELERRTALRRQLHVIELDEPPPPAAAYAVVDREKPEDTNVLKVGDHRMKLGTVPPGLPLVLTSLPVPLTAAGRRTALAEWLAQPDHPLTARVMVNRIWQFRMGRGIVGTPNDFGVMGERPTNPKLLDWLASEFVSKGWSVKAIDRLILLSSVYRQSAARDAAPEAVDPENKLYWRMNKRRLEGEAIRDSVLAVSGMLNPEMGGPPIRVPIEKEVYDSIFTEYENDNLWPLPKDRAQIYRRSLYLLNKRTVRLPMLANFDQPDAMTSCAYRPVSTHALQALSMINSDFMAEQSAAFAKRVAQAGPASTRVQRAYQLALARAPKASETAMARDFFTKGGTLQEFCLALLNRNEFIYIP